MKNIFKLLVVNEYTIRKKGIEAINFCKENSINESNNITIEMDIELLFSYDDILNSEFLSKIFKEDNFAKIRIGANNRHFDFEKYFHDIITYDLNENSENLNIKCRCDDNELEFVERIIKLINEEKYLNIEFDYSALPSDNDEGIDEFLNSYKFNNSAVIIKDINGNKYRIDKFLKDDVKNKIKMRDGRKLIYLDKNNLFQNHFRVLFYVEKETPNILWSSGCVSDDIIWKMEQIKKKYIIDNYEALEIAENYINKIKLLLNSEFIDKDKYKSEIDEANLLIKEIENKRNDIFKYKININNNIYPFELGKEEAKDFCEKHQLEYNNDKMKIFINKDIFFSEIEMISNEFMKKIFESRNSIYIELNGDFKEHLYSFKDSFEFKNSEDDPNVIIVDFINKLDFINLLIEFIIKYKNNIILDEVVFKDKNNNLNIIDICNDLLKLENSTEESNNIISNVKYRTLIGVLKERKDEIINNFDKDDYYYPKNLMWLERACKSSMTDMEYLSDVDEEDDDFSETYYDLICLDYIDNKIAIPVPVIAKWIGYAEENILSDFFDGIYSLRNEEDFI